MKKIPDNKGFSLVELIIVIAVMGILIGVVGTQVMPYMERSREAKDKQILSSVATAMTSAIAMEGADSVPIVNCSLGNLAKYDNYAQNFEEYQGNYYAALEKRAAELLLPEEIKDKTGKAAQEYLERQFASKKAKENKVIYLSYFPREGKLYVFLADTDATGLHGEVIGNKGIIWDKDEVIIQPEVVLYIESN